MKKSSKKPSITTSSNSNGSISWTSASIDTGDGLFSTYPQYGSTYPQYGYTTLLYEERKISDEQRDEFLKIGLLVDSDNCDISCIMKCLSIGVTKEYSFRNSFNKVVKLRTDPTYYLDEYNVYLVRLDNYQCLIMVDAPTTPLYESYYDDLVNNIISILEK